MPLPLAVIVNKIMRAEGILFLIAFGLMILGPFILMFVKASYHFKYLKLTQPEKLKQYNTFIDTSRNVLFNKYVILYFPIFKRSIESETTPEIKQLAEKVRLYIKLLYYDIILISIIIAVLIIFFGDFD